jgi:hypothetical protein
MTPTSRLSQLSKKDKNQSDSLPAGNKTWQQGIYTECLPYDFSGSSRNLHEEQEK